MTFNIRFILEDTVMGIIFWLYRAAQINQNF